MKIRTKILLFIAIALVAIVSCDENDPNTVAGFTFSPEENLLVGDTVYFTNTSAEAASYEWDFGDSNTSSEESPFHIYAEPGIYDVTLVASNGGALSNKTEQINVGADLSYIINYGSYSGDKGTVSAYNKYTGIITNNYYKSVNGVDMISNVQYAYHYKNNIYFMGNNADEVFFVDDKTFEQTKNAITTDVVKPRYCAGEGDYLYVSCWGGEIWADETVSYIAKVNLNTNIVESKISIPGGPEGLAITKGKLYAALNYKDSIAVMDLSSEALSFIETPAVTSFFVKDSNDNLYVSLVSTFSDYSDKTGLAYINTSTDQLEASYNLTGVSTSYVNILAPNTDFSKIYVMTSAYDANWNLSGAVASFDVASKSFDSANLVEGISGLNGIAFNNDNVFCFIAESVTANGKAVAYSEDGTKQKEHETGIAPFMLLAVE